MNIFLIIFLSTIVLTLFMLCYIVCAWVFTLAKQHRVPIGHYDAKLTLLSFVLIIFPIINVLFALLLAVAVSSPRISEALLASSEDMLEEEVVKFDNHPTVFTALRIATKHVRAKV